MQNPTWPKGTQAVDERAGGRPEPMVNKYHTPQIAVIIPHYEHYADFITDALLSVQQQTHTNFICVVVDDCSSAETFLKVNNAVEMLGDERFRLIRADENRGQIPSVYRGLDETRTDFACILDPDDRYTPQFLEKMLALHLNSWVFCPVASCDQYLLNLHAGLVSGTSYHDNRLELSPEDIEKEMAQYASFGFHKFTPPTEPGWHWTSTSSIMFRTDALRHIKPFKTLLYKGSADDYFAQGAHMMGGSLFLRQSLVYRGLHQNNYFMTGPIFSVFQKRGRTGAVPRMQVCKADALEAFLHNGGLDVFELGNVRDLIAAQFRGAEFEDLLRAVPQLAEILGSGGAP